MKLLSEFMEFRYGSQWRELPEAVAVFEEILGMAGLLLGLGSSGKVALPPGVQDAA